MRLAAQNRNVCVILKKQLQFGWLFRQLVEVVVSVVYVAYVRVFTELHIPVQSGYYFIPIFQLCYRFTLADLKDLARCHILFGG